MKLKSALEGIGQGGHQEKYAQHGNRAKSCLMEARAAVEMATEVEFGVLEQKTRSSFCLHLLGTLGLLGNWGVEWQGTEIQKAGVPEPPQPPTSYVTLGKSLNPYWLGVGGNPSIFFL